MKKLFTLLLFVAFTATAQVPGAMIKDIAFKSEAELTAKYGKPKKTARDPSNEPLTIDDLLDTGNYTLEWKFKNGERVEVEYRDKNFTTPSTIYISDIKTTPDNFYKLFGWDKPKSKFEYPTLEFIGLSGFKANYDIVLKSLFIIFDNPKPTTFGKRI